MNERRKQERLNFIDRVKNLLYNNDYDVEEIKRLCRLIRLEIWTERLLDKTHEW